METIRIGLDESKVAGSEHDGLRDAGRGSGPAIVGVRTGARKKLGLSSISSIPGRRRLYPGGGPGRTPRWPLVRAGFSESGIESATRLVHGEGATTAWRRRAS